MANQGVKSCAKHVSPSCSLGDLVKAKEAASSAVKRTNQDSAGLAELSKGWLILSSCVNVHNPTDRGEKMSRTVLEASKLKRVASLDSFHG